MILHIITRSDWARAEAAGEIRADGDFLHCSDPGTVHLPADRLFAGRDDLLLAVVDPALVPAGVRWEPGDPPVPGGPWFPHVYGPIPLTAVVRTHPFPPGPDGTFALPDAIAHGPHRK